MDGQTITPIWLRFSLSKCRLLEERGGRGSLISNPQYDTEKITPYT